MRLTNIYELQSMCEVAVVMYFKIPLWKRPGLTAKNRI